MSSLKVPRPDGESRGNLIGADRPKTPAVAWENLPSRLEQIARVIRDSHDLMELEDEEGIRLCDEATWQRAVTFLINQALWLLNEKRLIMQTPDIWAGPDQSIDLHWESSSYELLINVPADANQPAGFYGDDRGKLKIKGTLDPSRLTEGLLLWLEKNSDAVA